MATGQKRYFAYMHDQDGWSVADLGDFDSFLRAVTEAIHHLDLHGDPEIHTVRVVDTEQYSQTIWMAGRVQRLVKATGL